MSVGAARPCFMVGRSVCPPAMIAAILGFLEQWPLLRRLWQDDDN